MLENFESYSYEARFIRKGNAVIQNARQCKPRHIYMVVKYDGILTETKLNVYLIKMENAIVNLTKRFDDLGGKYNKIRAEFIRINNLKQFKDRADYKVHLEYLCLKRTVLDKMLKMITDMQKDLKEQVILAEYETGMTYNYGGRFK